MLALMLLTIAVAYVVGHSRFGIRLNAIREDEVAAEALGIDATRYKLAAFVLSAVFPAVAGGIQAYKVLYIDPPSVFFVQITIAMALMSMLGGKGTVIGPIVGAVLLYTAQELTWVNFPTAHLIAYGLFIVVVARFMPRGLDRVRDRPGLGPQGDGPLMAPGPGRHRPGGARPPEGLRRRARRRRLQLRRPRGQDLRAHRPERVRARRRPSTS